MNEEPKSKFSPSALIQTIKVNLLRRPLWRPETVGDCLDLTREQIMAKIQNGDFPFVFEVGNSKRRAEPRILALSVVEQQLGPIPAIGATRNLKLPEVINLILPMRDIRSKELERILACDHKNVYQLATLLKVTRPPTQRGGPNSYSIFSRSSVIALLTQRRML